MIPKPEKSVKPNLDLLKSISSKNPKFRTQDDLDFLFNLTRSNKVFASLSSSKGPSLHRTCCKYLNYEFCAGGSYLFEYGSKGSKFYIILSGKIGVEVPKRPDSFEEVLQLADGDCFGELALESDKPRQASIKCKVDCHFLYLHKKDYQDCIGNFIKERRNLMVSFLSGLPLFQDFTKGTLTKISYILKEKTLKKGQVLYKEGEESNEIFFVKKGETGFFKKLKAKSDKKIATGVKVQDVNVANKAEGEMFGEEEVVVGCKRTCTCRVISDGGEFFYANKDEFFKSVRNEEFWKVLRTRVLGQLQLIEDRVELLCELKNCDPVFPLEKHEKAQKVTKHKPLRKSMTNIGLFLERASVDLPDKNHDREVECLNSKRSSKVFDKNQDQAVEKPYEQVINLGFKRSSTILAKFPLFKSDTPRSNQSPVKQSSSPAPQYLTPIEENKPGLLLKRSKSSLSQPKNKPLQAVHSIVEVLNEDNYEMKKKSQEHLTLSSRCSSGLGGYLTTINSAVVESNQSIFKDQRLSIYSNYSERSSQKKHEFFNERIVNKSIKSNRGAGVSVYNMNSYPIYLALWSPNPRIF